MEKLKLQTQTMIAKKTHLTFSNLQIFSLQFSLQSCQLNPSLCLQIQVLTSLFCKEKQSDNQQLNQTLSATLLAKQPN